VTGTLIVTGLVAAFVFLDQLLLAAERRGWVRWRRSPPSCPFPRARPDVGSAAAVRTPERELT
jgi:hypothetical protein